MFGILREMRDALIEIRDSLKPVDEEESDECPHLEDWRVDLRSIGEREHWICRKCKYEYLA